jgi:MEMO1 family protein
MVGLRGEMEFRRAAVAGSWYPRVASRLAADVDRYMTAADVDPLPDLRAIIAPHAGLMYSGSVAAFSYKAARGTPYGTIVLVGPSHHVDFRGISIWPRGSWETPFGPVGIDEPVAAAIAAAASGNVAEGPEAHVREHSLELQLPFVAHVWPGARIVALVMGRQTRETAFSLGDALASAVAVRPDDILLVASSDLSHYEDAPTASALDSVITRHVDALDPEGVMAALEREPRHACGGGPIVSVLHAARTIGASHGRVLRYADSGDVTGDKSSVVGYMAAAIW